MTKYSKEFRESAFKLYSGGMPILHVCKQLNISTYTFYKWQKKYNWKTRSKEVEEKGLQKANETIAEIKVRQHKLNRVIEGMYAKQLKEGKVSISTNEVIGAMKHDLHLFGEAETSSKEMSELDIDVDDLKQSIRSILGDEGKDRGDSKTARKRKGPEKEKSNAKAGV